MPPRKGRRQKEYSELSSFDLVRAREHRLAAGRFASSRSSADEAAVPHLPVPVRTVFLLFELASGLRTG
eukprot:1178912-Prorocentrum_minimum.AAC.2